MPLLALQPLTLKADSRVTGSTYTGAYESVQEMSDLLDEYERKTGISVPIHVDGASGAMFAPFATPSLIWDFRIPVRLLHRSLERCLPFGVLSAPARALSVPVLTMLPAQRVVSINTSLHKWGKAYVGVGAVLWRSKEHRALKRSFSYPRALSWLEPSRLLS